MKSNLIYNNVLNCLKKELFRFYKRNLDCVCISLRKLTNSCPI